MPIHLAPISRRKFLLKALSAGAAVTVAPRLLAASKRADENSWALLSDIHLAANRSLLARKINMTDHFVNVSHGVLALPKRPAAVIITGDCAYNSGETADYEALADLLQPLRAGQLPIHLALGNHDHRDRFWQALQNQKVANPPLQDKHVALITSRRANWFMLDSLDKTLSTPGLLGTDQLKWLATSLDANPDKPALILVHHNPGVEGSISGLKDTEPLFEIIRPRRHVKACIYGHTHTWKVEQDVSGIHLVNLPPVAYVFREGDPAGWVHTVLERKGMQMEFHAVDPSHKANGQIVNFKWRQS
jgi:3',5'-cyclic AMP phosphodiesterase CpdA